MSFEERLAQTRERRLMIESEEFYQELGALINTLERIQYRIWRMLYIRSGITRPTTTNMEYK